MMDNLSSENFTIATLGEINLDISCVLSTTSFEEIQSNKMIYTPINSRVGGTGGSFAIVARKYFSSVSLFGCIGYDAVGDLLKNLLVTSGISTYLLRDPSIPSRIVFIVHEKSLKNGPGIRLLLTSEESPSYQLAAEYMAEFTSVLQNSDILLVSGYLLLKDPARTACLHAMHTCSDSNQDVALDLVPHNIDQLMSLANVHHLVKDANILISELKTIRRLLSLPGESEILNLTDAITSVPDIRREFPGMWFLLRFGIGNIDESLVVSPTGEACHSFTGYRSLSDTTGFGDELTARELYALLSTNIADWHGQKFKFD